VSLGVLQGGGHCADRSIRFVGIVVTDPSAIGAVDNGYQLGAHFPHSSNTRIVGDFDYIIPPGQVRPAGCDLFNSRVFIPRNPVDYLIVGIAPLAP